MAIRLNPEFCPRTNAKLAVGARSQLRQPDFNFVNLPYFRRTLSAQEAIAEYINQVIEDGDTDELVAAIGNVAKARGMTQIANASGLGRESLYKAFSKGAKPRFDTVMKVMAALGIKLRVSA